MTSTLSRVNEQMGDLTQQVLRSVVRIHAGRRGSGAGIVWRSDGLIVTNAHVVRSAHIRAESLDGNAMEASVLAQGDGYDLALLKVNGHNLEAIALGDSKNLRAGELVTAFGHPWGVPGAATSGVVIGVGDKLPELAVTGREWLVASLHLRPGHSGGPMVDAGGRLVGINTMMNGPDVGVAIPVHVVKAWIDWTLAIGPASDVRVV